MPRQVDKHTRLLEMRRVAESRGGELLDDQYRGVDIKVRWRCANGHEFLSPYYSVVVMKKWCNVCAGHAWLPELRLGEANAIAIARGGRLLSTDYVDSTTPLRFRCGEGHEWEASLSNLKKNKWCPWCAGNKVDLAERLEMARKHALNKGGVLLSASYLGNKAPMRWRCKKGHEWEAAYNTVVNRGAWCALCSGTTVIAEEQLARARECAERKQGQCLSTKYVSNSEPMEWQCERGHRWKAVFYSVVQAGGWCPVCSDGLRERLSRHAFEALLDAPFKKALPTWLRNPVTGRRLELDGFNESLRIAFEYQGEQHKRVVLPFKMTDTRLKAQQERDRIKREACAAHGVRLIEVPNDIPATDLPRWVHEALSTFDDLRARLKPWQAIVAREWLESEAYIIDDLRSVAAERGGECVSPTYLGAREKHRWRCAKGHEWSAVWDAVRRGGWCPTCFKPDRVERLAFMQRTALSRGGECLSPSYEGSMAKYRWRCAEGHEWEARWNSVQGGSWCPRCAPRLIALTRKPRTRQHSKIEACPDDMRTERGDITPAR